jgi:hypothetical protein
MASTVGETFNIQHSTLNIEGWGCVAVGAGLNVRC